MTSRSAVHGLGYLGVTTADPEGLARWESFATDVLGMEHVEQSPKVSRFKMDVRTYRLAVHIGIEASRLAYVGWEVQDATALESVEGALHAAGVPSKRASATEAQDRRVGDMVVATDPAGTRLEFFYGPQTEEVRRFNSPRDARFVTGDQGMGHFVISVGEYQDTVDFYVRTLGFSITDYLVKPFQMHFLGCNSRHHSIGIVKSTDRQPGSLLDHFMIEATDLNTVGEAYDRCFHGAAPLSISLGRHWNDHMTSFYVQTPSHFNIEYGWGGRQIDRSKWVAVQGTGEVSFWGHEPIGDSAQRL